MNYKKNKGITLVALVITIIVLIILAAVSINAVMNGGLIENAKTARNEYEESSEKEELKVALLEWQASKAGKDNSNTLFAYLVSKYENNDKVQVNANPSGGAIVTFTKSGKKYIISEDGKVTLLSEGKQNIVQGNYICARDVYPINHDLKVTLSSDTITDFSSVKVYKYGSNLININQMLNEYLVDNGDGTYTLNAVEKYKRHSAWSDVVIPANVPFDMGATVTDNQLTNDSYIFASFKFADGTTQNAGFCFKNAKNTLFTFEKQIVGVRILLRYDDGAYVANGDSMTFKELQLNIGHEQSYEKYVTPQTVSANADGTVSGLTSLAPNMTLVCNNDEVKINCEYNKTLNYNLEGKTIVNFGDSIFGMFAAPSDISTFLAKKTNATVYNAGFSGTRMSAHTAQVYDAFSMYNLADSIANNDWTLQENAIADKEPKEYFKSNLNALKQIDFNSVDIITIAQGTNEFAGGVSAIGGGYNKYTYQGALEYSIETIQEAYPHIEIVICSPTYRFWTDDNYEFKADSNNHTINGQKLTDFVAKAEEVAEEYGLLFIDNYNGSGINYETINKCFNTTTDGTHPNAVGREMIAENMARVLYNAFGK